MGRLLLSASALLLPAVVLSSPCVDYSTDAAATFDVRGVPAVRGVAASGSTFYLARTEAFEVWDGSDPAAPALLGSEEMDRGARHVVLSGSHAFVPVWWRPFSVSVSELRILDVSDPGNPRLLKTVPFASGESHDVAVAGGYAYVANGSSGIAVVDVEPPASSSVVATIAMPGEAWGITVLGDRLIVAAGSAGMRVYGIADPTSPVFIANRTVAPLETMLDVAHDGAADRVVASIRYDHWNHNYRTTRISVLDVTTPAAPSEVGSTDALDIGRAVHVDVSGDRAYVAATDDSYGDSMLEVVDLSDPFAPAPIGFFMFPPESAQGVAVLGDHVVLGEGHNSTGAFQIVDVSKPFPPVMTSTNVGPALVIGAALHGDELYVGQAELGLTIRDALDPAVPVLSSIPVGDAGTFAFAGDVLWAGFDHEGYGSLRSYDVSDPSNPVELGTRGTPSGVLGMELVGDLAYLAQAHQGYGYQEGFLEVVDTSDPAAPALVGSIDLGSSVVPYPRSLVVHEGYLHLPWSVSLVTYDVSDPSAPTAVGSPVVFPGPITWVERRDDLLLVAVNHATTVGGWGVEGFHVLSLVDPAAPLWLGSADLPSSPIRIDVVGDVAYVACPTSGMHVVSLEDPGQPVVQGGVSPGLRVWDLVAGSDRVFLTAGRSRKDHVVTVPLACLASATAGPSVPARFGGQLTIAPNPFRPSTSVAFSIDRAGPVDLAVYDVTGRRVAELLGRRLPRGDHRVTWNGRNDEGAEVAAGVYFFRLRTDARTRTRTVQRLR